MGMYWISMNQPVVTKRSLIPLYLQTSFFSHSLASFAFMELNRWQKKTHVSSCFGSDTFSLGQSRTVEMSIYSTYIRLMANLRDFILFCSSSEEVNSDMPIYINRTNAGKIKCPERDSNPWHPDLMKGALTTELPRQPQWSESNISYKGTPIAGHLLPDLSGWEQNKCCF